MMASTHPAFAFSLALIVCSALLSLHLAAAESPEPADRVSTTLKYSKITRFDSVLPGPTLLTGIANTSKSTIVFYQNMEYATLDSWSPLDFNNSQCQSSALALPDASWSLAEETPASLTVAGSYPWGTNGLVLAIGTAIYTNTPNFPNQQGLIAGSGYLGGNSSSGYSTLCDTRILIQRPASGLAERCNQNVLVHPKPFWGAHRTNCPTGTVSKFPYADDEAVYLVISPPQSSSRAPLPTTLTFTAFQTGVPWEGNYGQQHSGDVVNVYQCADPSCSPNAANVNILSVNGHTIPSNPVTSLTGAMVIEFVADSGYTFAGWVATWTPHTPPTPATTPPPPCPAGSYVCSSGCCTRCHPHASIVASPCLPGSYVCSCHAGWHGSGQNCTACLTGTFSRFGIPLAFLVAGRRFNLV